MDFLSWKIPCMICYKLCFRELRREINVSWFMKFLLKRYKISYVDKVKYVHFVNRHGAGFLKILKLLSFLINIRPNIMEKVLDFG